ncbi:sensor histidine kinase [Aquimarina spongiae]|uniref:histidine kinase n=1 Tax=Aquimarina spongiae TaxID=570521 RepID=A0A1M6EZS7_9FLAO|nr:ATP-binding protein [Aquimarina spongiae]SHI90978.1 Histidine kinase-, DNA gyrase B-, and HSP90-like ATPase [Aquimarina spongiae]
MLSKRFYIRVVIKVLVIVVTTLAMVFLFLRGSYAISFILLLCLMVQTDLLIKYVNQNNKKIIFFFNAIKNEDFTLQFPEEGNDSSFNELNTSLNRLNNGIQKIYLQNQAQEQYNKKILNQVEIGILTFNNKGHILFSNPKMEKLLNYKPLNHIKQIQLVDQGLFNIFKKIKPFERKLFQLSNERESIQLAIKSSEIISNGELLTLITVQDIKNELDKKETDSWIKLIRVLTHEIINTVTPITSISASILNYYKDEDKILPIEELDESKIRMTAKGLEVIKDQGNDLMSFVKSYRSFLNVPAPDKALINVDKLLEKVLVLMTQNKNEHVVDITITSPEDTIEIYADEKLITQVLVNLSKNAIQALNGIENAKLELITGVNENGKKYISVKDNGPGIPPDILQQIFVPFYTTKNEGTGIGLSLSKQIMHLHGGNLTVHSILHKETVFTLLFE